MKINCDICKKNEPYIEKENYLNRTCNNCFFEKLKIRNKEQKDWKNISILEEYPFSWGDLEKDLTSWDKRKLSKKLKNET